MLLPRPEIRTATRLGSRMMDRGPVLVRAPAARPAAHRAAALSALDRADSMHRLARLLQLPSDGFGIRLRHDDRHSEAGRRSAGAATGSRLRPRGNYPAEPVEYFREARRP